MPTESEARLIQRVYDNCKLLYDGWDEEVEYVLPVTHHVSGCKWHGKTVVKKAGCENTCETSNEKRKRTVKRKGLLDQLQDYQANKDTDRNPQSERQAPRVKKVKFMPELNGFFALDEIMSEINIEVDRFLDEAGRDRTWAAQPVRMTLQGLRIQVAHVIETRPDLCEHLDKKLKGWVATARSTLKITVGDAIFDGVVCGNCGGGLASPWGNRGEASVRCVGSPSDPPCGHEYPMSDWLKIYEGRA
jgi:hypothetical protein